MQSTASLRLPLQSPPVSRAIPAGQGHRHPGGIEATAECAGAPTGIGSCYGDDRQLWRNDVSCRTCCNNWGRGWWIAPGSTTAWECTVGEVS